jgi:hypothetical protein
MLAQSGAADPRSPVTASEESSFVTAPATLPSLSVSPADTDPSPVQVMPFLLVHDNSLTN